MFGWLSRTGRPFLAGIGFGVASGVNTTLGILVGAVAFGMAFREVVASVVIVALSDALSDAMSMHASEEMAGSEDAGPIMAMAATFITKFSISIAVALPVFFLGKKMVWLSIGGGAFVIVFASALAAKRDGRSVARAVTFRGLSVLLVILASISVQMGVKAVLGVG